MAAAFATHEIQGVVSGDTICVEEFTIPI